MLGFGALGQFALGQVSTEAIFATQYLIDDAGAPERLRRQRKRQEEEIEAAQNSRDQLRGSIYDAIHPPQEFEPAQFNPGLFAQKSYPLIGPGDPMVNAVIMAAMNEKKRQKMQADMQEEDDIEMLLRG